MQTKQVYLIIREALKQCNKASSHSFNRNNVGDINIKFCGVTLTNEDEIDILKHMRAELKSVCDSMTAMGSNEHSCIPEQWVPYVKYHNVHNSKYSGWVIGFAKDAQRVPKGANALVNTVACATSSSNKATIEERVPYTFNVHMGNVQKRLKDDIERHARMSQAIAAAKTVFDEALVLDMEQERNDLRNKWLAVGVDLLY